ncbi:hypothetical protein [Streptomyces agglomeratus]|nr:hypothetical protein [Streptomyces agglomeratus]
MEGLGLAFVLEGEVFRPFLVLDLVARVDERAVVRHAHVGPGE